MIPAEWFVVLPTGQSEHDTNEASYSSPSGHHSVGSGVGTDVVGTIDGTDVVGPIDGTGVGWHVCVSGSVSQQGWKEGGRVGGLA